MSTCGVWCMVPGGKGQKGGLPLALSRLLGSCFTPWRGPFCCHIWCNNTEGWSSSFSTQRNRDVGQWGPGEAQQDFKPSAQHPLACCTPTTTGRVPEGIQGATG